MMEDFFIGDQFCRDIEELMEIYDIDEDNVNGLEDDWAVECFEGELQPIFTISVDWIMNRVDEMRFSEESSEKEYDAIVSALKECIDFEKLNAKIPKLYYPTRNKFVITKEDLL